MPKHWIFGGEDNTPDGLAEQAATEYPERSPGFVLGYVEGWNDAKAGRQYGEGRHGTRHVGDDGHEGCRMVYGRDLQGLRDEAADQRAEIERLRGALRVVASNMRALEDGGCDFPRVTGSFTAAVVALSGQEAPHA